MRVALRVERDRSDESARATFTSELSRAGVSLSVDHMPAGVSEVLSANGINHETLARIAGADGTIRGDDLGALYDEVCARAQSRGGSANIEAVAAVYQALRRDAPNANGALASPPNLSAQSSPRGVGLGANRRTSDTGQQETPVNAPPPPPAIPEGYEHRTRRVNGHDENTHTVLAPADELRAAQIAALPPATTGHHASVRSYLDAIAARDRMAELQAGGDRRGASRITRPEGVSADNWALTRALQIEGISTRDVESYLATGQLPDLLDDQDHVLKSGADRMQSLERSAAQGGSWTATNSLTFLISARRSAMAAERQAMQTRADTLPANDPLRAEIAQAIEASTSLDRELDRGMQGVYRARTFAAERQGQRLVDRSGTLEQQAADARARGDAAGAARLQTEAQQARDRGALLAQAEGNYRRSVHAFDASTAYRLAARAQIETGNLQVTALRESPSAPPANLPAVLGDGDEHSTTNGVAGAGNLLNSAAATSTDGGHNHAQLGLETARQGLVAQFHQIHVDRSTYNQRVGANGQLPPVRSADAGAHRQAYLDARAEQARTMMERIGLYGPVASLNSADAALVGRLESQTSGIMQEMNASLGTSLSTDRALTQQNTSVTNLQRGVEQARSSETEARTLANNQASASADQRSSASAVTRVFQTSGAERRDLRAIDDANAAERVMGMQADVATVGRTRAEARLGDATRVQTGLIAQQARDRADAERVRTSLARIGTVGQTTNIQNAYDQTRSLGDSHARASATALDRADSARDPQAPRDPTELSGIASTRLDLARYWTGTTEMNTVALGDAGRTGATDRLNTAASLIDSADATRRSLDAGSDDRRDLAAGVVRERSALATANADYRPAVSRDQLRSAEAVADADLAGDRRLGEARGQIGTAAVQSLARHNARFEEVFTAGQHDDTADDDLYAQGRRLLGRRDLPDNDTVRGGRSLLRQIDEGLDQVPLMYRRSARQIENGMDIATAQTSTMGYAEGTAASAKMSGLITGLVWAGSIGNFDMKDEVQNLSESTTTSAINSNLAETRRQVRGANDLAQGFENARANGHAFQYLNSYRIVALANTQAMNIPMPTFERARDFMVSQMPATTGTGPRAWAAFNAAALGGVHDSSAVPLMTAMRGSVLSYADAVRALGDERMAVVTFNQQGMLTNASRSLKDTTDGMWWYIGANAIGEVTIGIILTGGLGSAAAVGEAGEAANTIRTGMQAANVARTVGTLSRVAEAVAIWREAHPILHAGAVALTVGSAMAATNYASGRIFGRNSAITGFVQVAGNFIPIGAANSASRLSDAGRRLATIGEEGAAQASRGTALANLARGAWRSVAAHANFYGPQVALATASIGGTMVAVPLAARALGLERNELAQAAMGVVLNAFVASSFAAGMSAASRRAQSTAAAEHLVNGLAGLREGAPLTQSQRAEMQAQVLREIDSFQSQTQGRMPTAEELSGLQNRLAQRMGVDPATPSGQQQSQLLSGAVEAFRVQRATQLGMTEALREQRVGPNSRARDRIGAMVSHDELSPSRPPTRELTQRAVDLAAERLFEARGGESGGASRAQAYRDAAQQISATFFAQRTGGQVAADSPFSRSLRDAEGFARDRATAFELNARLRAGSASGAPPVVGRDQAPQLDAFLSTELGRARSEAATGQTDMAAHWQNVRGRLETEVGLSRAAADTTMRAMQIELFRQATGPRIAVEQGRAPARAFNNAELAGFAREEARRLGLDPVSAEILARETVQARPALEQGGVIRPGGETSTERTFRELRGANRDVVDRFVNLTPDQFVAAFGERPNMQTLDRLSVVTGYAEMARTDPARARAVLENPPAVSGVPGNAVDALLIRSVPFAAGGADVPGLAGGVQSWGRPGRWIRTPEIAPGDLPYPSSIRPAQQQPNPLPTRLQDFAQPSIRRVTDSVFASDIHSGSAGLVRLAELADGRPVAIKTYYSQSAGPQELQRFALEEARSAQMLSDMGIGPQFHGVFRDAEGRWNVVMDVVPGDFGGTPARDASFRDLETILARSRAAGVLQLGDFQTYRTPEGRLLVIDPGAYAQNVGQQPFSPPDSRHGDYTSQRLGLLREAPLDVGTRYLEQMRANNPTAWQGIMEGMRDRPQNYQAYSSYLGQHGYQ